MTSSIGDRLRHFAKSRHGTVAELNRAIGKGRNYLGTYIENRAKPGSEVLAALAEAGLNINWLLTGEGEMLLHPEEAAAPFIGDVAAGRVRATGEQPPAQGAAQSHGAPQVISGVIESATFTIRTNDGRKYLVIQTDNK